MWNPSLPFAIQAADLETLKEIYLHQIAPCRAPCHARTARRRTQKWVSSMARGQRTIPTGDSAGVRDLSELCYLLEKCIIHHFQNHSSWRTRSMFYKLFSQICTNFTGRQRFTSLQKRHHSCGQLTLNVYCWMVGTEKVFNLALFGKHQVTSMMCL